MHWILPPMSNAEFISHMNRCENEAARGVPQRFMYTTRHAEPGLRPQHHEMLFVRVDGEMIGYHEVIGSNRAFDGDRAIGWNILYNAHFIEIEPVRAPAHPSFGTYNPPGEAAALPLS